VKPFYPSAAEPQPKKTFNRKERKGGKEGRGFKPFERNGFVEQLERIERFERLEHSRAEGVPPVKIRGVKMGFRL
jgi:hypothetical protein